MQEIIGLSDHQGVISEHVQQTLDMKRVSHTLDETVEPRKKQSQSNIVLTHRSWTTELYIYIRYVPNAW